LKSWGLYRRDERSTRALFSSHPSYYFSVPLIECVPNISEGRRRDVIDACASAVGRAASLLDVSSDATHHRSVLTFAGSRPEVEAAARALFEVALPAIDVRRHDGQHPRVGAVDVMPLVPLGDSTMEECVELARAIAGDVARRFDVPVYLYEQASRPGVYRRLEDIRRGGLSALAARMAEPAWRPDFGPMVPHPTAGVSVVGARPPLIAYNVELATPRIGVAQTIARSVRQNSGGLPAVKAIAIPLPDREAVQVSMNLTDYRTTSIAEAFGAVEAEAQRLGVAVLGSELVGLAPAAALTPEIAARVRLRDFNEERMILERRLDAVRSR
jgi:glutamate formiminotransferase